MPVHRHAKGDNLMKRFLMAGASTALAASMAVVGLMLAGPASASATAAAAPSATTAKCTPVAHNYPFPHGPKSYGAGVAGSVTVAPVNSATIKVAAAHPARGYRAFVDSAQGSSVDVYFSSHTRSVKFEAEINDWGGLTVTVTTCRR
jgi:hypothetical protein